MSYTVEEILEQLRLPEPEVSEEPIPSEDDESEESEEASDIEGAESGGGEIEVAEAAPAFDPEAKILELAGSLGRDQKMADSLWKSGVHEARLLATHVADPEKVTVKSLAKWIKDIEHSDLAEQVCQNLIAESEILSEVIETYLESKESFGRAIGFGAMACLVIREPEQPSDLMESWLEKIAVGAEDEHDEVRQAVLWALLEIGQVDEYWQDAAIVLACELQAEGPVPAEIGHEAEEKLSQLTNVGDRRRLVSGNSKSAKNQNAPSQNSKRRGGGKNNNRRGRGQQKQNASDSSGAKKPARRNGRNKRRSRASAPKTV